MGVEKNRCWCGGGEIDLHSQWFRERAKNKKLQNVMAHNKLSKVVFSSFPPRTKVSFPFPATTTKTIRGSEAAARFMMQQAQNPRSLVGRSFLPFFVELGG